MGFRVFLLSIMLATAVGNASAQDTLTALKGRVVMASDENLDSLSRAETTQMRFTEDTTVFDLDTTALKKEPHDWSSWRPNPQKALWMALVIPGGGQIYNRKYWKLPIIYGGMVGCVYAMNWNNMMYKDYSQAYLDIMDSDPNTQSYNKFLHLGMQITPENEERYKKIFKSRKDRYRRWRDLSVFCMIGVYALSVIDAYVDAELSEFDISDDLSLRVEPVIMGTPAHDKTSMPQNGHVGGSSIGVNCSLNF